MALIKLSMKANLSWSKSKMSECFSTLMSSKKNNILSQWGFNSQFYFIKIENKIVLIDFIKL